ncbi:DUF2732 family protein [Enterobacter ludwigii]|jgi:hypothetical protein|uniref:DUF2732 family protein n=1 Tax=Enterobacter TaxID=547 RepID=UPI00091B68E3|nr:DUF2732 family protein [Enterobacter ludwigii]EKS6736523.1 DUF2732 domain-containing protein [Enterobacter ludwigii]EKS7199848.1 DUF2732 domain-containing protein [Enterobacter ludwigii]MBK1518707.1 DUF2732 domain-containing protein [Enterobacter ludwigii]MCE1984609.1 DUF2732 domain-containing protein [Enterobacter ludwigii]MRI51028.1 DUF2732 domain-containing protein [Enterobacter ludwigii]
MRNSENRTFLNGREELQHLLVQAKMEERRARALAVSLRLEALASHIYKTGMCGEDAAELLCHEAARYERESQELH